MGYTLEIKIDLSRQIDALNCIQNLFQQQAKVAESFSNRFVFSIPRDCIKSLATVFQNLETGNSIKEFLLFSYLFKRKIPLNRRDF